MYNYPLPKGYDGEKPKLLVTEFIEVGDKELSPTYYKDMPERVYTINREENKIEIDGEYIEELHRSITRKGANGVEFSVHFGARLS